jgi:hypothetical protein
VKRPTSFLVLLAALLGAPDSRADSQASSTGKGTVGVALLGAEAVTLTEAAFGVRPGWAYLVGGLAGAAGGGVGGYFLEDSSPRLNIYLLAAGMALVIPTTVAVLSATAYEPPAEYTEDRGPIDEPGEDSEEPSSDFGESSRTSTHTERHAHFDPLTGLVGYREGWVLSVPAVSIGNVYSKREMAMYGVDQQTEVRLPVLDVHF